MLQIFVCHIPPPPLPPLFPPPLSVFPLQKSSQQKKIDAWLSCWKKPQLQKAFIAMKPQLVQQSVVRYKIKRLG